MSEPISKVLAFFVNFTFDRAVEPFYGITFGFFAKKAWKIKFLTSGKASTMQEIANKLKMDRSYLARTLQLANLAPDIVKLIWENRQPETLTLDNLRKSIPESWEEQRKRFLS